MAVVFLLGPSRWREERPGPSPMDARRRVAAVLAERHRVLLMEDLPDDERDRDLLVKFDRVLDTMGVTDVVVHYPRGARMATTFDELLLLAERTKGGPVPRVWILHEHGVATFGKATLTIHERGDRSRYLTALPRLRPAVFAWSGADEWERTARFVSGQL